MRIMAAVLFLVGCTHPVREIDQLATYDIAQVVTSDCYVYRRYVKGDKRLELFSTADGVHGVLTFQRSESEARQTFVNDLGVWRVAFESGDMICHADNQGFSLIWRDNTGDHRVWVRDR